MSFRYLFGLLAVYTALAWVLLAQEGVDVWRRGLLWTGAGLAVVFVLLVLDRPFAWFRRWLARKPKPKPAPEQAPQAHEDDAALAGLWREAATVLAGAPTKPGGAPVTLAQMPMFLLVGGPDAGKTSTFANSGAEPQLLAGQANGTPTRVANLWMVNGALYVEIAGRIYDGGIERWRTFLKGFIDRAQPNRWNPFAKPQAPGRPRLKGVVLVSDIRTFIGGDPGRTNAAARTAGERLEGIAEVFGGYFPVYALFTKADEILYFKDFFARLQETETWQPSGFTLPAEPEAAPGPAGAPDHRLNRAFGIICQRLAERRILHLWREKDAARRQAVYEFPREFRRLRRAIIGFLVEAARRSPLKPGPVLRGFYFSGAVEFEAAEAIGETWSPGITGSGPAATIMLRADPTRILSAGMFRQFPGGRVKRQWLFARELFESLLGSDRPPLPALERPRPVRRFPVPALAGAAAGLAMVCCLLWFQSWLGNSRLLDGVRTALRPGIPAVAGEGPPVPTPTLERLEKVRAQLEILERPRSLWMNWGLYAGRGIRTQLRAHYYGRLRDILLARLNRSLALQMKAAPAGAGRDEVYDRLAAHLAITGSSCEVKPEVVARVLKGVVRESGAAVEGRGESLAALQIDYYAAALSEGNPVRLELDEAARGQAQRRLSELSEVEPLYRKILEEANRKVVPARKLADRMDESARILTDRGEVPPAFTREGAAYVLAEAKRAKPGAAGDPCITGMPADAEKGILRKYVQEYRTQWKQVLSRTVQPYRGLEDAVQKLGGLSGNKSPILALLSFTSDNTYFTAAESGSLLREVKKVAAKSTLGQILTKRDETTQKLAQSEAKPAPEESLERITTAFAPVRSILPPASPLVNEKGKRYADALAELRKALVEIGRSRGVPDPAVIQAATAQRDKALDVVRDFTMAPEFGGAGLDGVETLVGKMLRDPIDKAAAYINPVAVGGGVLNAELARFCAQSRSVLEKYPFNPNAQAEASLEELAALFSPTGAVWKYRQESLGPLVEKQGSQWARKGDAQLNVSHGVLAFLNRAQQLSDGLFAGGAAQAGLRYSLRPQAGMSFEDRWVEFEFDGRKATFTKDSRLQKDLLWPAPRGTPQTAVARVHFKGGQFPIAIMSGLWGAFRVFSGAEPRGPGEKRLEWRRSVSKAGTYPAEFDPPVLMEFVEFPGGIDLFNPQFFQGLRCPQKAVE